MTWAEVKETLEKLRERTPANTPQAEALDRAIRTVEAQIELPPILGFDKEETQEGVAWICRKCGSKHEIMHVNHRYCPHCGQAVQWR
jgi:rubrerythrin